MYVDKGNPPFAVMVLVDLSIFDIPLIQSTHEAYLEHKECDKSVIVLMTGRHVGLKKEVNALLDKYSLDFDAYLFNVVKYVARAGKKDQSKELEDLKKAAFYLNRKIKNLEK